MPKATKTKKKVKPIKAWAIADGTRGKRIGVWHRWTKWYVVTDAIEKRQERFCVKCNYRESAYIHTFSGGGL